MRRLFEGKKITHEEEAEKKDLLWKSAIITLCHTIYKQTCVEISRGEDGA